VPVRTRRGYTPNVVADYTASSGSFDVGSYGTSRTGSARVLDGDGTVLFDSGDVTIPGQGAHNTFPTGGSIASSRALRIQLFHWGDLGVDNVDFSQRVIPSPALRPCSRSAPSRSLRGAAGTERASTRRARQRVGGSSRSIR